ncbi:hypothetical protein G6F43_010212 [Rhizopus delemar]|nr:hypothetical protein G6F43_010212 [Rhizopus delemar]
MGLLKLGLSKKNKKNKEKLETKQTAGSGSSLHTSTLSSISEDTTFDDLSLSLSQVDIKEKKSADSIYKNQRHTPSYSSYSSNASVTSTSSLKTSSTHLKGLDSSDSDDHSSRHQRKKASNQHEVMIERMRDRHRQQLKQAVLRQQQTDIAGSTPSLVSQGMSTISLVPQGMMMTSPPQNFYYHQPSPAYTFPRHDTTASSVTDSVSSRKRNGSISSERKTIKPSKSNLDLRNKTGSSSASVGCYPTSSPPPHIMQQHLYQQQLLQQQFYQQQQLSHRPIHRVNSETDIKRRQEAYQHEQMKLMQQQQYISMYYNQPIMMQPSHSSSR